MVKVLEFSVRANASEPFARVRNVVEQALGLTFEEGEFEDVPALVANSLGMHIGLFKWGEFYLLESRIDDVRFLEAAERKPLEVVRVSEAFADMLTTLGPVRWRVATEADLIEDRAYGDELDRQIADDEGAPPWA
ncbi:hypothetical protein [Streptomyces sp. NPDC021224]|uniref:hypothetical protein n=1 Tax=unclassified Streptomyces TaxID=2593676 RepID=UPI0037977370